MGSDRDPTRREVPRLDLADFRGAEPARRDAFVATLREAFTGFGFVRLVGHGVDPSLVEAAYAEFRAFFAAPEAEKRRYAGVAAGQRGFTPFGIEHAKDHPTPDLKEFFHVGREVATASPHFPCNVWPEGRPALREVSLRLYRALEDCAGELLEALATGFGLPRETFASMLAGGNSILRALHYPPVSAEVDPTALRAAPHEDINLVTLLCGATDSGLEILTHEGRWLPVETRPDEIVADAGDMLARVTNGVVPSTTHRVVVPGGSEARDRHALPFFAHPYPDCDLSVLPRFVAPGEAPRFPSVTAAEYLAERLREIGLA